MQQLIEFLPPSDVNVMPAPYRAGVSSLTTPDAVADFLRSIWVNIGQREAFYAVYLNNSNKPIAWAKISDGGVSRTMADPRIIFKHCIDCLASGLIVAHNHPSGKCEPSPPDEQLTSRLKAGCDLLEIRLLDHLILMPETGFYSFAENGRI